MLKHLQGYLLYAGITTVGQIKVGCFDRYQVWRIEMNAADGRNPPSNLTLKKEATIISGFICCLVKKRLLDPYEVAQKQDISSKIRLSDTDFDSNPPIRDTEEWLKILVFKEQKKQQQPGLSSIYDHINTQTKYSKKWMNKHLNPTKKGG